MNIQNRAKSNVAYQTFAFKNHSSETTYTRPCIFVYSSETTLEPMFLKVSICECWYQGSGPDWDTIPQSCAECPCRLGSGSSRLYVSPSQGDEVKNKPGRLFVEGKVWAGSPGWEPPTPGCGCCETLPEETMKPKAQGADWKKLEVRE